MRDVTLTLTEDERHHALARLIHINEGVPMECPVCKTLIEKLRRTADAKTPADETNSTLGGHDGT